MQTIIISELKKKIIGSEFKTEKTKINGKTISSLICPECGDKSAWAYAHKPFSINCNRLKRCGARTPTLSLFPEVITNIEKEYKPTPQDRNKPATEFLRLRGIDKTIEGLNHEYWPNVRKSGSGAVMFQLTNGSYNGRLFNPPKGEGKTHNRGTTKGAYWKHPGFKYDHRKETYVTEGIIDALSLLEMGYQAIAVISSGQDPANVDLSDFQSLTLAFDNDRAGWEALKKWKAHYPKADGLMPDKGKDWNDYLRQNIDIKANRDILEFNAGLALCESAGEYAKEYKKFYEIPIGLFEFDGCYYYSGKDEMTYEVSDFTVKVDHFIINGDNPDRPEYKYHIKVRPQKGKSKSFTAMASEITTPNALRNTFAERVNAAWTGSSQASNVLFKRIVGANAPEIRQLSAIGYDQASGCYVFPFFMINQKGTVIKGENGIYKTKLRKYVRTATHLRDKIINPAPDLNVNNFMSLLGAAWGPKTLVAITWVVASWFVSDIKEKIGFFPFLSFYGEGGTGKTTFAEILQACQCIKREGVPMRQANTAKGVFRLLTQRNGLFEALLEESKDRKSRFDYRFVLSAYNDAPLYVRAEMSNDNATNELAFKASVLFVQNNEPFTERPAKERVISLLFKKDDHDDYSLRAVEELKKIKPKNKAYFYQHIMRHHPRIKEAWYNEYDKAKGELLNDIPDNRIREVHALILAFYRVIKGYLGEVAVKYEDDIKEDIIKLAHAKIKACKEEEVYYADTFFDFIKEEIENKEKTAYGDYIDYREEESKIYIHLNGAISALKRQDITLPLKDLKVEFKSLTGFIKNNCSHRFNGKPRISWAFDSKLVLDNS